MRLRSLLAVALFAAAALPLACGSGGKQSPVIGPVNVPSANASATAANATSPLPSGLPPMASMPPPGVAGSRKAKTKANPALYDCGAGSPIGAHDPADQVKRIGEACAAASKMHPAGPPLRGQSSDRDPHQEHRFHADANKCYRVYFATDEAVRDAVVVMRDSSGDVVAESPGSALPEDGSVCFTTADDVSLLVAIGSGKGAYVAQVWSD
ncbi:MAG TPA: hypothetical protein VIF62_32015 [Labilithrix sp.]|jgi:hypothetical protein